MAETKREFRLFTLTDYEAEEAYLRRMANAGWRFTSVNLLGVYHFERCQPEDVVYKLDFRPLRGEDKEAFLSIYREYGWEYMQEMNDFCYFRKPAADTAPEDLEIFSDYGERFAMVKRIFTRRMLPLLVVFFLCVLPSFFRHAPSEWDVWQIGFVIMWSFIFLIYITLFIRCGIGFYRLWKKYGRK